MSRRVDVKSALLSFVGFLLLTAVLVPVFAFSKERLLVVVAAAGLVALLILASPYVGILVIWTSWFIKVAIVSYAASALLAIPLGLSVVRDRQMWVLRVPQVRLLLTIAMVFLLSIGWNDFLSPVIGVPGLDDTTLQMRIFATRLVALVLMLYFVRTYEQIQLLVWLVLVLIVAAAVSGIPAFLTGSGFRRLHATFSLAENANRLAFISLFGTSLLWFYREDGGSATVKRLTLPFLLLLPVATMASASRSGFLQSLILAGWILGQQRGWSPARRARSLIFLGAVSALLVSLVPAAQLMRATTFDPSEVAQGQDSLRNRINTVVVAARMVAQNPFLGVGIGNFVGAKRAAYGLPRREHTHNAYLWAATSGGLGVLALYLLLLRTSYRTLRHLETVGPRELLWVSKGLRVNLILFMVFSMFADIWLTEFFYLLVGLPPVMLYAWLRSEAPGRTAPSAVPAWRRAWAFAR